MSETTSEHVRLGEGLQATLDALTEAHDALGEVLQRRREAIRSANARQMAECTSEEASVVSRIRELDRSRRELSAGLASTLGARAGGGGGGRVLPRVADLAQALGGEEGERLEASGRRLRAVVERTQGEVRSMRAALRDLAAHAEGLMAQVSRRLSDTGTYSPHGVSRRGGAWPCGIDVTR